MNGRQLPVSLVLCVVSVLGLLCATTASAFYVESRSNGDDGEAVPVRYLEDEEGPSAGDVHFRINTATLPIDGADAALEAAFATWSAVDCTSLEFVGGVASDSTERAHWMWDDGDIYLLAYFSDDAGEWSTGPSVGHYYWAHGGTGRLIGGTIVLNARDHAWATDGSEGKLDVQSIATALIGRALGITSAVEGNATYPRYRPGDIDKRMLGEDEAEALRFLYPGPDCASSVPEEMCDGTMRFDDTEPCPPRPETSGGTGTRDAGGTGGRDAAIIGRDAGLPDAASMPDAADEREVPSDGCSASGSGGAHAGWAVLLLLWCRRRCAA